MQGRAPGRLKSEQSLIVRCAGKEKRLQAGPEKGFFVFINKHFFHHAGDGGFKGFSGNAPQFVSLITLLSQGSGNLSLTGFYVVKAPRIMYNEGIHGGHCSSRRGETWNQ
jgi:hypothetical protein